MAEEKDLIFETKKLTKHFGPTVALNEVDIKIYRGQITGLIGENGSGKSTITSIAAGMQPATSGEMYYKGQLHKPSSMIEGATLGIGMIVQEQGTLSGRTVAQNIFAGQEKQFETFGLINKKKMNIAAHKALEEFNIDYIEPDTMIDQLDFQDRKLIEIVKVAYNNPEMVVVDETTTALSQKGRGLLYDYMKRLKKENKAVVFISHDLEELIEICDTLTVLRDGSLITTLNKDEMNPEVIKRYMVGREVKGDYYRSDQEYQINPEVVLEAKNIVTGTGMLMNFSMQVHQGEILGVGGLSHCGMHELGRALFGEEVLLHGSVTHCAAGQKITTAMRALKLGMGYVSKDRDSEALVLTASIKDNILAAGIDKVRNRYKIVRPSVAKTYVKKQIDNLSIKCASLEQNVQYLSGGNKQKVVFGKWMGRDCDILILDCPTRGVDIGVKASMYHLIRQMKKDGKTVIIISEELPELIGLCDRILILKDGEMAGEFRRGQDMSEHTIIEAMI